ncbi:T9SS type A sorting domain-containing protein [Flavobacterium sp. 25HG05S-40]|uniref:T9SS type A sorting domain-containing protein n=1 Tax=Flavobacterium sp. 25HG05S-40 TaxID=3458682 RepID=UPI004044F0F3
MNQNYYWLSSGRDTWLKDGCAKDVGSPPTRTSKSLYSLSTGWLFALLLLVGLTTNAQVSSYGWTQTTGAYSNLTFSPSSAGPVGDDAGNTLTIPFSFSYNGASFTSIRVCTNGWISFNAASTSNSLTVTDLFTTGGPNYMVAAWLGDGNANAANGGSITAGAHPSVTGVYVVQYRDVSGAGGGAASATAKLNFQIWLHGPASATPGVVELRYGTSAGTISTARSLGIENAVGGTGNYLNALNGLSNSTTTAAAFPASGTLYRFTPPVPCTGTPTAGTVAPAVANLCPGSTQVFSVTGDTTGVSGLTYLWETSPDGVGSWAPVSPAATGATYTTPAYVSGTQYYRRVTTCSTSGLSDPSAAVSVSGPVAPTTQITNLASTTATTTSITMSWTVGNGNQRSVFVNSVDSFTNPTDLTAPGTAATLYAGSGQQLVFNGTGTTVTVTGLTIGTTYYFRAYESRLCTSPNYYYNTTGASVAAGTADRLKYTIARSSATYTPVSGSAITLSAATGVQDDTNYGAVTFFPFTYAGATVSQFRAVTNGFMTLNAGNTATAFNNGITNSATNNFVLAPFWEDLYVNNNTPNSQFVKYEITGSTPNRVLTVQWENIELFNYPGPSLNFQVKLYEGTNVVEYVYGVMQGFDGTNPNNAAVTNGLAFSYTMGMSSSAWASPALAGEVIGLQQANSLSFTSLGGITTNEGLNKLSVLPECNTKYTFTPAGTVRPNDAYPGVPAAPANDEPANAVVLTTLPSTPANFCGSFYSSAFATPSATLDPTIAAPIASTIADDDVWFKFTAISANTTITLRGAGGYDAAMQLFNAADLTTAVASKNANALAGTSLTETITGVDFATVVNSEYLVRVYHAGGGTQATATATVTGGAITGFTITTPGTGYITCNGGAGLTATPFVYITDATGAGAVAKLTITGGAVTAIALQGAQGGTGYSATPTVTVAPSSFGVTGDFSIIVNATPDAPANDNICTAVSLPVNATCVTTAGFTTGGTASPQASCAGNADDDVWYSFVATVSNPTVTVNGTLAGFDGRVQILSSSDNTCTGTLTSLFCQSNVGGGSPEVVSTTGLTIGNTYFVRVYHNAIGAGTGNFTICVTAATPACLTSPTSPADASAACEGIATTLSWPAAEGATGYDVVLDGTPVSSNQAGLTFNAGILASGAHTWTVSPRNFVGAATGCPTWSFTTVAPPTAGAISGPLAAITGTNYSYDSTGGSGFASLQWKSSLTLGGPYTTIPGATTTPVSLTPNTAGTIYLVAAYINGSCEVLSNELAIVVTNPPGSVCSDAIALTFGDSYTTGNLATGGSNVDVTTCGFNTPGNERYYTFTSTVAGTYTLDITNSNGGFGFNDYFFKVAAGTADCDLATGWSCIDDNSGVGTDTFTLAAGTTYYLLVDAESAASTANHTFRILAPSAPNCVVAPTAPVDGASTVGNCAVTLSWPTVPFATGYDVYLDAGASATTLVSSNQTGLTYNAGTLLPNQAYAWSIVPRNAVGPATGCATFTFTTIGGAPACIASPTSPANGSSSCGVGNTTFTWPASPNASSYSLVIDGGTPIVQTGLTFTTAAPLSIGAHTWSVTPSNCNGAATGCATWSFTTEAAPAGDTFANPVLLGAITATTSASGETSSACWNDDYNAASTPGSTNGIASTKDVFYKFSITEPGSTLSIGTCTTSFDTFIHLLNSTGTEIGFDDDACVTPNSLGSSLPNLQLAVGDYYVVIQGGATGASGTYTLTFDYVSGLNFPPSSATAAPTTICVGDATTLTRIGGSLVSGATWQWFSGACGDENGGVSVGTGTSINVSPSVTTTYYVRAQGGINTTTCASVTVTVNPLTTFYFDGDADGFGDDTDTTVSCTNPGGYSLVGGDCNDGDDTFYPGAPEVCWNGILENCTGVLSQGCAAVPVNMTPSYNNSTLVSLATAIPAVPYSFGGFTNIKYRFSITNTTTGVTAPDIIQTSRFVTIPGAIHTHGASYTITASAVINEEIVPFAGNTITVNSPSVPVITLSSSSCGATLATLASSLTANPGLNATGYTFRIRLNDSNPTPTYGFSPSATRFVGANTFTGFPLNYGASYRVAVQYTFTDPVSGLPVDSGYGAECVVNTPSIPVTSMASPTCGGTVSALNANMAARAASYATGYRFRIRLFSDNGPTPTYYQTAVLPSRFSSLTAFQGITIAYSTEYSISVQYSVLNGATTEWSAFGPDCKVTTPFFPTTSLVPSQCGLLTPTSLTQQLNITPYPGFPNYKVLLEEIDGETVVTSEEREIVYSNFKLSDFAIAQLGKNYNISVAIKLNGVFGDYSTACDVFTAAESKALIQTPFAATAYPNPFANNFMLDVKTSSQSSVSVKVYDMVGRLIEQRDVRVSDMESTTIGNQYPSGVYNVVVAQEDNVQTVRVVKR